MTRVTDRGEMYMAEWYNRKVREAPWCSLDKRRARIGFRPVPDTARNTERKRWDLGGGGGGTYYI